MKNYAALILSTTIVIGLGFGFSSCKDDEPPAKPKLSFAQSAMTVGESDGVIEVELVLDKPYSKDLTIEYDLGGTASDQDAVGTANADYEVVGDHGVVVIESGETSGIIELEIFEDGAFESDETIEISIMDTNTADVEVTADDEIVITISNDDAQLVASFATTTMTVNENDGPDPLLVTVQLDNPATSDITIEYTLPIVQGENIRMAVDSTSAAGSEPRRPYDYYIDGVSGELVIPAGETSADIRIQVVSDLYFEGDETIQIELTGSNSAIIGTSNTMTITVEQEDGKVIGLLWDPSHTDVDMDMFLFVGDDIETLEFPGSLLALSINASTDIQEEVIFLPTVLTSDIEEAAFGLSYVYYEGTASPMNFEVHFVDLVEGEFEPDADRDIFPATYTAANLNEWDKETGNDPIIVQTFRIVTGDYIELTDITVPDAGSRMKGQKLPDGLQKSQWKPSRRLSF